MSILNAFVYDDHALIGVDTEAMLPDGSTQQVCKLIVTPQLSAVTAFRGLDYLQMVMAPAIAGFKGTFDEMADHMPGNLRLAEQHCREQYGATGDALAFDVVLIGWSEHAKKMVGLAFIRTADDQEIRTYRDFPIFTAPLVEVAEAKRIGVSGDRSGMEVLARHQCQLIRSKAPNMPAGGDFFIVEARHHSLNIVRAFEFPARTGG